MSDPEKPVDTTKRVLNLDVAADAGAPSAHEPGKSEGGTPPLGETAKAVSGISKDVIAKLGLPDDFRRAAESINQSMAPFRDVQARMRSISDTLGANSAIGKVAEQIARQQKFIDGIPKSMFGSVLNDTLRDIEEPRIPRLPDIKIPPNPGIETNARLKRIEQKFDQMHSIATEAASIANGLQGAATEFLVEFKTAARGNDRASRRAIRLGVMAVAVAVFSAVGQIVYTEFWRVPADAASMQLALDDMKREIVALRERQIATIEQLSEAIGRSDGDLARSIQALTEQLGKDSARAERAAKVQTEPSP